jgi:immunoglobulin-binding protein 1
VRKLHLASIALAVHDSFASLESIALERHVLAQAPPPSAGGNHTVDPRARQKEQSGYSERLDPSLSSLLRGGRGGPILDKSGKPLQPFTLLDKRAQLRQGVFRPDYNLPTMSIDEYLDEERRRGGIIEGGGEQSGIRPEVDEDDMDKADEATMKARAWDEFADQNPKGSGNTLNRG